MKSPDRVPIWTMDCRARCFAVFLCLTDEDLQSLGAWAGQPSPDGLSPQAWSRSYLQVECAKANDLSHAVQDLLDLRFCDEVESLRHLPCSALSATYRNHCQPESRSPAGLFWALVTDPRPEAQRLASIMGLEILAQGCQQLQTTARRNSAPRP